MLTPLERSTTRHDRVTPAPDSAAPTRRTPLPHQRHASATRHPRRAPAPTGAAPEPKKKTNAGPMVAALAVGAILGGASGAGVAAVAVSASHGRRQTEAATPQTITVNDTDNVNAVPRSPRRRRRRS